MENINTLLVAFMFITILTIGVAGVLTELADVVRNAQSQHRDRLLVGWAVLLLFANFVLFWHTADIALREEWGFGLFLFAETGPVLLLFSTQIMVSALRAEQQGQAIATVNKGRFFVVFGLLQAWSIAADFVLGIGFTLGSALSAIVLLTCLLLAWSANRRLHVYGLGLVWSAYIASAFLESAA